jgi:hypothetical protein
MVISQERIEDRYPKLAREMVIAGSCVPKVVGYSSVGRWLGGRQ